MNELTDDFGVFESPLETPPAATSPKFRKEIDLGDGSGIQVFEADTAEGLIEKLTEAQRNATAEIRRLQRARPKPTKRVEPAAPPLAPSPAIDWNEVFGEQVHKALPVWFQEKTGVSLDEIKGLRDKVAARERVDMELAAAYAFLGKHTVDYHPTPNNYSTMINFLDDNDLEVTEENLEYAFSQLQSALDKKPAESVVPEKTVTENNQTNVSTGISSQRGASPTPVVGQFDAGAFEKAPLGEAREMVRRALRQNQ